MALTEMDLIQLRDSATSETRIEIAKKTAMAYAQNAFSATEKKIAEEILRLLVADAETRVRQMLSDYLANLLDAPHEVMLALARDLPSISLPVLEHSYVLTEEDLIAIAQSTHDALVLCAIARRESVSQELSAALIEKSQEEVIITLLGNKSANIGASAFEGLMDDYRGSESILELLVHRGNLPTALAEKLFLLVSNEMRKKLCKDYNLPFQMAEHMTLQARDLAMLGVMDYALHASDMKRLVQQLHAHGKLDIALVIRTLSLGDVRLFEHIMAELADVPLGNAQLLLFDQGRYGFEALYKAAHLPQQLYEATHYLFRNVMEQTHFGQYRRHDFLQHLITRIRQDGNSEKIEYLDYLMTLIQHNARYDLPDVS
jgi:uncharacterized protein (DUF2336 family)